MKNKFNASRFLLPILLCLWSSVSFAVDTTLPHFKLDKSWGIPVFSENVDRSDPRDIKKYKQWRFNRNGATLYFTEVECPNCKPYEQADAEELRPQIHSNGYEDGYAMIYKHRAAPSLVHWSLNPKKQFFKLFKIRVNNFYYELQFSFGLKATPQQVFEWEQEFFKIINDFDPNR